MSLLDDILSLDGLLALNPMVQDRLFDLRLLSRKTKMALESNLSLNINIRINDAGVEGLTANFLQKWNGSLHLYYTHPWKPGSRWFQEVRDALALSRLRPLRLLSLSVEGSNLHPLVGMLVGIESAIQKLELSYRGNGTELIFAAAALGSLGRALTMEISVEGSDRGGSQTSAWTQLASTIRISSISLRPVR
jgi:hypothetical protein